MIAARLRHARGTVAVGTVGEPRMVDDLAAGHGANRPGGRCHPSNSGRSDNDRDHDGSPHVRNTPRGTTGFHLPGTRSRCSKPDRNPGARSCSAAFRWPLCANPSTFPPLGTSRHTVGATALGRLWVDVAVQDLTPG